MSRIQDKTNITAGIAPFDNKDTFETHSAIYGKGGYRTVKFLTDRDAIPDARRELLMLVAVEEDGKIYQLVGGIENTNWQKYMDQVDNVKLIPYSEKAANNGVATLDASGKIPTSQLPSLAIEDVYTVNTITERDNLAINGSVQSGDVVIVATGDTYFYLGNSNWAKVLSAGGVTSVNGLIGTVNLITTNIPEGSNLYYTDIRADARITIQKGAANGIATLGADKKIPIAQLPALTTDNVTEGTNKYYTDTRVDVRVSTQLAAQKGIVGGIAGLDASGKIPVSELPSIDSSNTDFSDVKISMRADTPATDTVHGHVFVGEVSVGGIDNYVVCHFNGNQVTSNLNNETTSAPDTTGHHNVTGYPDYNIIPGSGKWGGSLVCNGSLKIGFSNYNFAHDFDWTGDYTLDFWMNLPSGNPTNMGIPVNHSELMTYSPSWANDMWRLYYDIIDENGQFKFQYYQNGAVIIELTTSNMAPYLDSYHHYAYVKALDQLVLYVDGIEIGRSTIITQPTQFSDYANYITLGDGYLTYNIDEIRFSKGIARWTSNFDVATSPYVADLVFAGNLMYEDGTGNIYTLNQTHPSASNVGTGLGIFQQIYNSNFRFKSIKAGSNISIADDGNTITISAAAQASPVTSVNTKTGTVILTTDDISEGSNKYYTDARTDARITAQKAVASGLATLDALGKIPSAQLPPLAITDVEVVADYTARNALSVQSGDVAKITSDGTTWIYDGTAWQQITGSSAVQTVNGKTGTVSLISDDIAEGSTNKYYTDVRATAAATSYLNSQKGVQNGIAGLGSDGKVPSSQLPTLGGTIAISGTNPSGTAVSVSSATAIQFDNTTGLKVTDLGNGSVLISLGSSFKTINNPLGVALVASGEDSYTNVTPGSIQITGDNTTGAKKMTFKLAGDSLTPGNSMYYGTDSSGNKGFFNIPTSAGSSGTGSGIQLTPATISLTDSVTRTFALPITISSAILVFLDGEFLKPTIDYTSSNGNIILDSSIYVENGMTLVIYGSSAGMPAGSIIWVASTTVPAGFIKANGALISRTTYVNLFANIGTTFGAGDGSTTFQLPDLRGRFIRGYDDGAGIDTNRVFGSLQSPAIVDHQHTEPGYSTGGTVSYRPYSWMGSYYGVAGSNIGPITVGQTDTHNNVTSGHIESTLASGVAGTPSISQTGDNRPTNVALLACIKY